MTKINISENEQELFLETITECNFCKLKKYKNDARQIGVNKIVIKTSAFMNGFCVFRIPKDMEDVPKYVEPNDTYPNGDGAYRRYNIAWMMKIGNTCEC